MLFFTVRVACHFQNYTLNCVWMLLHFASFSLSQKGMTFVRVTLGFEYTRLRYSLFWGVTQHTSVATAKVPLKTLAEAWNLAEMNDWWLQRYTECHEMLCGRKIKEWLTCVNVL